MNFAILGYDKEILDLEKKYLKQSSLEMCLFYLFGVRQGKPVEVRGV